MLGIALACRRHRRPADVRQRERVVGDRDDRRIHGDPLRADRQGRGDARIPAAQRRLASTSASTASTGVPSSSCRRPSHLLRPLDLELGELGDDACRRVERRRVRRPGCAGADVGRRRGRRAAASLRVATAAAALAWIGARSRAGDVEIRDEHEVEGLAFRLVARRGRLPPSRPRRRSRQRARGPDGEPRVEKSTAVTRHPRSASHIA